MALKTLHLLTLTLTAAYEAGTITMSLWQEKKKKKRRWLEERQVKLLAQGHRAGVRAIIWMPANLVLDLVTEPHPLLLLYDAR